MIVSSIGYLYEILGLILLSLPLFFQEISRPRDSLWGSLTLVFGLILVFDYDRFFGAPKYAVILGTVIFIRLLFEICQYRWQMLTDEEKITLKSIKRFFSSFQQSSAAFAKLGAFFLELLKILRPKPKDKNKKWIRPDNTDKENPLKNEVLDSHHEKESLEFTSPDKNSSLRQVNGASEDS